ncbi:hypothetical protein EDC18_104223 [Natranaerovirga pectinivora]|uniref:Uncharacterized protein n=1 Tax=Natranaerovirga pectinivora TaxID=682400 RepID=A0A4R3MKS3_9FIRM|nr:hypothetical protein [Natranaerovirga pectinivora]TCT15073.1 hypothetical protein EDC18_104223 [Natranaerovirga pectinivora]
MSIRPLDMQVLIPRTEPISNLKSLENQKYILDQNNNINEANKNSLKNNQKVIESNESEKYQPSFDAKEKGSNGYNKNNNKEKKKNTKKIEDNNKLGSTIDIKI